MGQDNSQSWVRISYGTNKYEIDSNYNNTEVPANLPGEQASQSSKKVIAVRSKAKSQKRETVELPNTIPIIDIIKQYNGKMMEQFNSGESSFYFRNQFPQNQ